MKITGKLTDLNLTGSGLSSATVVLDAEKEKPAERVVISMPFLQARELAHMLLARVVVAVDVAEDPAA